jgi:hypothetical protein
MFERGFEYFIIDDEAYKTFMEECESDGYCEYYDYIEALELSEVFNMSVYQGLYFFITGTALFSSDPPTAYPFTEKNADWVFGIAGFYEEDGNSHISFIANSDLPDIIKTLEKVNLREREKDFNPKIFEEKHRYEHEEPWEERNKEEWVKDFIDEYNDLLNIYRKARDKNANIMLLTYGLGDIYWREQEKEYKREHE